MTAYKRFKENPWNFLRVEDGISPNETELLERFHTEDDWYDPDTDKFDYSKLDYMRCLIYQNNGYKPVGEKLRYDSLIEFSNVVIIMYVIELDTYIISVPNYISYSSIVKMFIISRNYSDMKLIDLDYQEYGVNDRIVMVSKDLKLVYDLTKCSVYLEGNNDSEFEIFRKFHYWEGSCSIRIYAVEDVEDYHQRVFVKDQMECINISDNTFKKYSEYSVKDRVIESESYGIKRFIEFVLSKDTNAASKLLTPFPIYKSGFNVNGYNTIMNDVIKNEYLGKLTTFEEFDYESDFSGFFILMKDCLLGVFFHNSDNKINRNNCKCFNVNFNGLIIIMNYYCYFIGIGKINLYRQGDFLYVSEFKKREKMFLFDKSNVEMINKKVRIITSYVGLNLKSKNYKIQGDFRNVCKRPIIVSNNNKGKFEIFYYNNIETNICVPL